MLTRRILTDRLIDAPGADERDRRQALAWRRRVSRRLGAALSGSIGRWLDDAPEADLGSPDRPLRVLDVGTGLADTPRAIVEWSRRREIAVEVTAVDADCGLIELARRNVEAPDQIRLLHAEPGDLMDHFEPGSFDIVHAGLLLNRLPDIEALTVLRIMDRLSRHVVVWQDVVRSAGARAALWLSTRRLPAIVRHDAMASVRAGFTRTEAIDLATRVGLEHIAWSRTCWRFMLTGNR